MDDETKASLATVRQLQRWEPSVILTTLVGPVSSPKPMKRTAICLALLLASLAIAEATTISYTTIEFDPGPPFGPGGSWSIPQWLEDGFLFTTSNNTVGQENSGGTATPDNGTAFLVFSRIPDESPFRPTSGIPFAAFSVDLAEYSTVFPTPKSIPFVGTRSDSSTVSVTFVTDGIIDGKGGVADFQTFFFPSTFTDLTSLRVDTNGYAMDNLKVVVVPEPSVFGLLTLGAAGAVFWPRRGTRTRFPTSSVTLQQMKGNPK